MGRLYHQQPSIWNRPFWLQLSIWVLIVSQHDQYVDCAVLVALSPPAFRFAIWQVFVESQSITRQFRIQPVIISQPLDKYQSDRKSEAGGERATKTANSTYWSYCDTIRTQILNWSQRSRDRKFETVVRFQPGQIPAVLCPVWVTNPPKQCGSGFWPGLEPNQTKPLVKTQSAGGLPGPVANTSCIHIAPFFANRGC